MLRLALIAVVLLTAIPALAADWPNVRGFIFDAISAEVGFTDHRPK